MTLALKGLAGPLKDQTFPLVAGMSLGRQGDVAIADTKASSIHARINQNINGDWLLEDNSSKNGTRIGGERVTEAVLVPGTTFYIGDQGFEVFVQIPDDTVAAPLPTPPPAKVQRYWYELLSEFLGKNQSAFTDGKRPVSPLNPALVLDFVLGLQVDSHWTLGYGPRKVGPSSLDLPILEPGAPAICFEVSPTHEGILFKTAHPEMVRLNGEAIASQVLRVGDTIRILETLIEVDFAE